MQLLLLIAGLVLLIAGSSWFTGAATVGVICLVLFGIATVAQLAVIAGVVKAQKSLSRGFNSRTRRGF